MPKRNTDPNQLGMFEESLHTSRVEIPLDLNSLQPVQPVGSTNVQPEVEIYPSVDLVERAKYLGETLVALGKHGRSVGLQIAGSDGSPFRRGFEDRYRGATDRIVDGAQNTAEKAMIDAKSSFAKAIGQEALIAYGLQTEEQAKQSTRADFNRFIQRYTGPRNDKNRRKMRQLIKRTHKSQTEIRNVPEDV